MKLMKKVAILAGTVLLLNMAGTYAIHESIGAEGRNLSGQTQHLIGGKGGKQKLIGGESGAQHLLGTEGPGEPRRLETEGTGNPRHFGIVQPAQTPLYPHDVRVNRPQKPISDIQTKQYKPMPH